MSLDEDLNLSWTHEIYQTLYSHNAPQPENVEKIRVSCVYLNASNEVEVVDTFKESLDKVDMSFSSLSDVRLLNLIETRKTRGLQKYKMSEVLSYIVDFHPGNWMKDETLDFFKTHTFLPTLLVPSTFLVFHRLNMVWIFFRPLMLIPTSKNTGELTSILKKDGLSYPRTKKKVRLIEPIRKTAKDLVGI
jgi:hypothetical protein